ncbi:flagellin [Lysobacter sp. A3-1-A15]|uniref:flagellin n=1 Tax=Novilysobacter viscosus TaxID=3098602 RepID=UPI002ED88DAD
MQVINSNVMSLNAQRNLSGSDVARSTWLRPIAILQQAAIAMLAQANQAPQGVLGLLH